MGKLATDACMYCPNLPHTFFICRRWCLDRRSLESGEGDFVPESIIGKMPEPRVLGEREVLRPLFSLRKGGS
jgi:hypothetical protein